MNKTKNKKLNKFEKELLDKKYKKHLRIILGIIAILTIYIILFFFLLAVMGRGDFIFHFFTIGAVIFICSIFLLVIEIGLIIDCKRNMKVITQSTDFKEIVNDDKINISESELIKLYEKKSKAQRRGVPKRFAGLGWILVFALVFFVIWFLLSTFNETLGSYFVAGGKFWVFIIFMVIVVPAVFISSRIKKKSAESVGNIVASNEKYKYSNPDLDIGVSPGFVDDLPMFTELGFAKLEGDIVTAEDKWEYEEFQIGERFGREIEWFFKGASIAIKTEPTNIDVFICNVKHKSNKLEPPLYKECKTNNNKFNQEYIVYSDLKCADKINDKLTKDIMTKINHTIVTTNGCVLIKNDKVYVIKEKWDLFKTKRTDKSPEEIISRDLKTLENIYNIWNKDNEESING